MKLGVYRPEGEPCPKCGTNHTFDGLGALRLLGYRKKKYFLFGPEVLCVECRVCGASFFRATCDTPEARLEQALHGK